MKEGIGEDGNALGSGEMLWAEVVVGDWGWKDRAAVCLAQGPLLQHLVEGCPGGQEALPVSVGRAGDFRPGFPQQAVRQVEAILEVSGDHANGWGRGYRSTQQPRCGRGGSDGAARRSLRTFCASGRSLGCADSCS